MFTLAERGVVIPSGTADFFNLGKTRMGEGVSRQTFKLLGLTSGSAHMRPISHIEQSPSEGTPREHGEYRPQSGFSLCA